MADYNGRTHLSGGEEKKGNLQNYTGFTGCPVTIPGNFKMTHKKMELDVCNEKIMRVMRSGRDISSQTE